MFAKLLKHEWRATRGTLGLLCLISLGASLMGGLTMRYLIGASEQQTQHNLIVVLNVLGLIAAIIAVSITGVAALVLLIGRFYKSRFTDEGYLAFTLPGSTHQNLLSSMLNPIIGMVIVFVVICGAFCIWMLIGLSALEGFGAFMKELWSVLPEVFDELGLLFEEIGIGNVVLLFTDILVGSISEIVLLMLAVTIGSIIATKHKILASVGMYYGIHVGMSMLTTVLFSCIALTEKTGGEIVFSVFSLMLGLTVVLTVAGYFLMYYLVKRKLNLN